MAEKITFTYCDQSFTIDDEAFYCEISSVTGHVICERLAQEQGYKDLADFKRVAAQKYPDRSPLVDVHSYRSIWMAEEILKAVRQHVRPSS